MNTVFQQYADFYDCIYADKAYGKECDYLECLWASYNEAPVKTVIDLGCGTGRHAAALTKRGFTVTGVDRSNEMILAAKERALKHRLAIDFKLADIRRYQAEAPVDTVISMFAVMGYLNNNDDLMDAFTATRRNLKNGGLFIFDVWYGPAVLFNRPSERMKEIRLNGQKVYRFAVPHIEDNINVIRVDYTLITPGGEEVRESHEMRYFFLPELHMMARQSGFDFIESFAFLSEDEKPSLESWNITCLFKAF